MILLKRHSSHPTLVSLLRPAAVIVILLWLFGGSSVRAQDIEDVERIRGAAQTAAALQQPPDAELRAADLDPRLRLPACPADLQARELARSASAVQVEVHCAVLGWKLYVPVSVRVQVPVLVAARPLLRGATVGAGDVEIQMRDRATLGTAWLDAPEQLQHQVLNRPVASGAVLQPSMLSAERIVRRGQSVVLIGGSGHFQVRGQGKALADAAIGDALRVENLGSRRVVQGRVQADGSVQVDL